VLPTVYATTGTPAASSARPYGTTTPVLATNSTVKVLAPNAR
jgi:hypothetical protein